MNPGVLGIPEQVGVRSYQTPWVPLTALTVGEIRRVAHPFDRVPMLVKTLVRCKVAQNQMLPGMVWQDNANGYRPMNCSIVMQPFLLEVTICNALGFLIANPGAVTTFTAANHELAFLVIA